MAESSPAVAMEMIAGPFLKHLKSFMKQKHINLLRAAANCLQSSLIQDENIADLKKQVTEETRKRNLSRVQVLKEMIAFARERNKSFLQQYADTIQQLTETSLTKLLEEAFDKDEVAGNPVFENYQRKVLENY